MTRPWRALPPEWQGEHELRVGVETMGGAEAPEGVDLRREPRTAFYRMLKGQHPSLPMRRLPGFALREPWSASNRPDALEAPRKVGAALNGNGRPAHLRVRRRRVFPAQSPQGTPDRPGPAAGGAFCARLSSRPASAPNRQRKPRGTQPSSRALALRKLDLEDCSSGGDVRRQPSAIP